MKIQHKVPALALRSDPITPEYQAEVDRATNKAIAAWERARRNLDSAERRAEKAVQMRERAAGRRKQRDADRELKVALELVELRREELQRLEAMMKSAPASAQHRGDHSYRPIPSPGGLV